MHWEIHSSFSGFLLWLFIVDIQALQGENIETRLN
jgi:hypothetical protein